MPYHHAADRSSQVNILKEGMPVFAIEADGASSHHQNTDDLVIEEWKISEADRQQIGTAVQQQLGNDRMRKPEPILPRRPTYTSEAQTNAV